MWHVSHLVFALTLSISLLEASSALEFANLSIPIARRLAPTCSMESGVDYIGNDLGNVGASQAQECCNKCASTPNCGAFTWTGFQGGTCWLKTGKGATKPNQYSQSAEVLPDPNGSCNLEQDVDIVGNDLGNVPGSAASDCCSKCGQVVGCNAFTWSSFNGGTCWLKTGRSNTKTTSGSVSASVTRATKCATTEPGVDYSGANIGNVPGSSVDVCCTKCSLTAGCGAFTWTGFNGGTCWLKSERGDAKPNAAATSGTVTVPNKCLMIEDNVDYSGADLGTDQSSTAEGCCNKCSSRYGCKAFTWTGFNGGTCWFKDGKGTVKSNQGARSGSVLNSVSEHVQYKIRRGEVQLKAVNLGSWLVGEQWQSASSPMWRNYNEGWRGEFATMQHYGHPQGDALFDEHRRTWITEQDIAEIARFGLNSVRVPVGYWIINDDPMTWWKPWQSQVFAPGGLKYLDKLINEWAIKYNLAVILSLHSHLGSQNGYDHSAPEKLDQISWGSQETIEHSVQFARVVAHRYKDSPAFLGMNLMNEPKQPVSYDALATYYQKAYHYIRDVDGPNDCILGLSPLMNDQGPYNPTQGWLRWPDSKNVWQEWHVYFNEWVYPNDNEDSIIGQVKAYKGHHLDKWQGNYVFMGEWSLAHGGAAPFDQHRDKFQQFADVQMQTLNAAHSGWAFWTWRHDCENSSLCGWSMRQMLREGIIRKVI